MSLVQEISRWTLYVGAVVGVVAPVAYAVQPWRQTRLGWHLMIYMSAIGLMFATLAIQTLGSRSEALALISFSLFEIVVAAMTWRAVVLVVLAVDRIRAGREVRRDAERDGVPDRLVDEG